MPRSTREQKTLLTPFSRCFPHCLAADVKATIDASTSGTDALYVSELLWSGNDGDDDDDDC